MKTIFYILSAIGSVLSGLFLFLTLSSAGSAPQEASGAAIAACIAIIPYVLARSIDKGSDSVKALLEKQIKQNNEIIILLKNSQGGLMLTEEEKASLYNVE